MHCLETAERNLAFSLQNGFKLNAKAEADKKEQPKYSIDDKTSRDSQGEVMHHSEALKSATAKSR